MGKINKNNKEEKEILRHMPDDERVKDEYWRLRKCYSGISGNKLKIVLKLIARAAFMAVTLEDLEKYISEHGCTEEYQNGENQRGKKKSSEVEVYNTMVKNYTAVTDKLASLLPQPSGNVEADDGFENFVNGRED